MYIYKITNKINNKVYIGVTIRTIAERYREHWSRVEERKYLHLYSAMALYGKDAFFVERIDAANTKEELFDKERYWVKYYNSSSPDYGYNNTNGGEGFKSIDLDEELLIQRYLETKSSEQVAKEFNCSGNTVLRRLKENNIKTDRGYSDYSLKVIELYTTPYTIKDICKILNLSNKTVMKILDENNIERHTFYESVPNINDILNEHNQGKSFTELSTQYKIPRKRLSKLIYYKLKI